MARRSRVLEYFEAQERERVKMAEIEAAATAAQQDQPQDGEAAQEEGADAGGDQQAGNKETTLLSDLLALVTKAITQWLGK